MKKQSPFYKTGISSSPFLRRDLSGKEERLHGKVEKLKEKKYAAEDKAFDTGKERHEKKRRSFREKRVKN